MATKLEKQIIQRMDGKKTFGQIGKEFGLSCQTIKAIAEKNGIIRPKNKSSKTVIEEVVVPVDGRKTRAFTERNDLVINMLRNGESYPTIAVTFLRSKTKSCPKLHSISSLIISLLFDLISLNSLQELLLSETFQNSL